MCGLSQFEFRDMDTETERAKKNMDALLAGARVMGERKAIDTYGYEVVGQIAARSDRKQATLYAQRALEDGALDAFLRLLTKDELIRLHARIALKPEQSPFSMSQDEELVKNMSAQLSLMVGEKELFDLLEDLAAELRKEPKKTAMSNAELVQYMERRWPHLSFPSEDARRLATRILDKSIPSIKDVEPTSGARLIHLTDDGVKLSKPRERKNGGGSASAPSADE